MSLTEYMDLETPIAGSELQQRLQSVFIDVNKKIDFPPVALSIGQHNIGNQIFPTAFGTFGNFSAIVGASKSKKTFLKSLLVASFIGGGTKQYANSILSHRKSDMFVIDIDTEQSNFHAQTVFKRTVKLVGDNYQYYKPYAMRGLALIERIQLIEYIIYESEYKDNIGLFCIDGIADLVADFNSVKECFDIVQKVMKWTDDKQFHLMTVIHQNSSSQKATGHLGSFIGKKAETVCNVEAKDGSVFVSFPYMRGFPIDEFNFNVNNEGLPYIVGDTQPLQAQFPSIKPNNSFDNEKKPIEAPF
jgi:hypothetical protein